MTGNNGLDINFPEEMIANYLKIVSNIYHINTRLICKDLIILIKSPDYSYDKEKLKEHINYLYSNYRKSTRNLVLDFFKVPDNYLTDRRILLKIYYCFLENTDTVKIEYSRYKNLILQIEENFTNLLFPVDYIEILDSYTISDEVINLEKYLNIIDFKEILSLTH